MLDELVFCSPKQPDAAHRRLCTGSCSSRASCTSSARSSWSAACFTCWAVVTPLRLGRRRGRVVRRVDHYFGGRRATWAMWVGIASLLLVTGLWNFVQIVKTYKIVASYHMLGTLKIARRPRADVRSPRCSPAAPPPPNRSAENGACGSACAWCSASSPSSSAASCAPIPAHRKLDAATPPQLIAPRKQSSAD